MLSGHSEISAGKQVCLRLNSFFYLIHIACGHFTKWLMLETSSKCAKTLALQVCACAHENARKHLRNCVTGIWNLLGNSCIQYLKKIAYGFAITTVIKNSDQCNTCTWTIVLGLPVFNSENPTGQIPIESIIAFHSISEQL